MTNLLPVEVEEEEEVGFVFIVIKPKLFLIVDEFGDSWLLLLLFKLPLKLLLFIILPLLMDNKEISLPADDDDDDDDVVITEPVGELFADKDDDETSGDKLLLCETIEWVLRPCDVL